MFDKYLNSIIQDEKTRMYVGGAVVIYIACFTNMIPNNIKKLLKMPVVRMLILASIAYLSTINFEGALMVTIIYFATTNCMTYEENFSNLLKETISSLPFLLITYISSSCVSQSEVALSEGDVPGLIIVVSSI